MDRALLDAMGVAPEAADAIFAVHEEEMQTLPPMLTGLPELHPPLASHPGRDLLDGMSAEEINRSWEAIREVLRH